MLAAGAATLLLWAAPAHAVTVVVHMYGPGHVKDVHAGGTLDCVTPESQPASAVRDCTADYGAFAGPEIQASVPGGWAGGQRFVGFDQPHTGEIDCDDAPLASAICTFGTGLNSGTMYVTARFTDTTPPLVSFSGGPSSRVASTSASFTFLKNDPVATFECNRDSGGWASCVSGVTYSGLSQGAHSLAVRGKDPSGNISATTTRSWTVDTVAPVASISGGPSGVVSSSSASFAFGANEAATFQCSLDGGEFLPCPGSRTYSGLADGPHTFRVYANDGLQDGPILARSWTVDTSVSVVSTPPALTRDSAPSFAFTSRDPGASFECALGGDGGHDWQPCTSPRSYPGLPEGMHTFKVRLGEDDEPASYSFDVDRNPPGVRIAGGPPSGLAVTSTSVTFALLSDENNATFECRFDGGASAPCASPITLSGLTPGIHEFDARATDAAGNTDPVPASRSFLVKLDQGSPAAGGAGSASPPKLTVTLAFFAHATAKSTRLTRLTVTGVPSGATLIATCSGKGCPRTKTFRSTRAGSVSLTPFRTTLRPGAKITVRVTRPGTIGAVKVLTIRKKKPPLITTLCVPPGASRATSC
jgi:hypothetical protein